MPRKTLLFVAIAAALATAAIAAAAVAGGMPKMGPATRVFRPAFHGYYDGHKDTFVNTDVSNKAEAAQMHINFSAALNSVPLSATPAMYMVTGRAAPSQLAVFGSEPGEPDYSPIWREVFVTWKPGVTPVLLVKDDQIKSLATDGKVTIRMTTTRLNCPIIKVG
jgi:hypothetical protein